MGPSCLPACRCTDHDPVFSGAAIGFPAFNLLGCR